MSGTAHVGRSSRPLVVGDIHGHLRALDALLRAARLGPGDQLVFLGDYVNGGPHSAQVIDRLITLQRSHGAVCLCGNHDDLFARVLESKSGMEAFVALGGAVTLASYGGPKSLKVPKSHLRFLNGLPLAWHDEKVICIHGQIDPHADPGDPDHMKALWGSVVHAEPHESGRTVICGHVSQRSGVPLDKGHTVCIDTAIRHGGWLTMLDAVGWTYLQANAQGDVRTGRLR
jgi:serine/threonine protein phosphatase 1